VEAWGAERFAAEAAALGYNPERSSSRPNEVSFEYVIENGPRRGETIKLGFEVPSNWPHEPPHGPCYWPSILRGTAVPGVHPDGRHFGPDWDHWSRPHPRWAATDQTLRSYMRHIRTLNLELPARDEDVHAA